MSTKRGDKDNSDAVSLTRKQRQLRKEIEKIASVISMDHWKIEGYEGPSEYRTEVLKGMKDQLVRSEVVMRYTLLDEFLTNIICDYYFRRKKRQVSYPTLWKTKPFKIFVHHLMDETYLLKKMAIVHAIKAIPSDVSSAIARINDVRNALSPLPVSLRAGVHRRRINASRPSLITITISTSSSSPAAYQSTAHR